LDEALDAATNPVHTIDIKCSDSWGFTTKTLTVTVTANTPPVFTGYPAAVPLMAFLASGQLITSIIDPFVVSSMLMLSFIFVIVCYFLE
jgi:hypothetical protein